MRDEIKTDVFVDSLSAVQWARLHTYGATEGLWRILQGTISHQINEEDKESLHRMPIFM